MSHSASPSELRERLPELLHEVSQAERIVIGTHVNPDGDALGSALALAMAIEQLGKTAEVLCLHEAPKYLQFLPQVGRIQRTTDTKPDLAIVVDLEALDRLGTAIRPIFESADRLLVIDHHEPHETPGDVRIVSVKSPATAVILADLFRDSEITVTPEMATCLMVGLVTDTGSFRFNNTTPHALHVAGELLEQGASLQQVASNVYMTRSLESVKLFGIALANMRLENDNQIAWTAITAQAFAETGAIESDTEGFVNELLAIETVKIAAVLRCAPTGKIKISLRSRGDIDVTTVARQFNGGGHKNAAGASEDGDIHEIAGRLVEAMKVCLASC